MIIDRRQTHLFSFIILACILPIIFLIGVFYVPQYPLNINAKINFSSNYQMVESENDSLILSSGNIKFKVNKFSENNSLFLVLESLSYLEISDPLIYWQKGTNKPEKITNDSVLLGELTGKNKQAIKLPPEAQQDSGFLMIYSPVSQEIKAIFSVDFT